jgi:hypothetical protein
MSLTVTQRPSITYLLTASRWNAVRNPVIYKMSRADYAYNQSNNSGGFMQMQFTGVNIASSFIVGNLVYATTRGAATVTASSFSGGNTLVTLNVSYTTSSSGSVNNLSTRPLYAVEVEVYDSTNTLLNDSPFRYVSDSTGNVFIDIASILKANLTSDFSGDLTGSTETFDDTDVYKKFYIKYREVWTGSAESQTDDVANQFFAILGALQIPSILGGNMGEYVVSPTKLLTKFTRFTMWRGYPFLIGAIIHEDISNNICLTTGLVASTPVSYSGKVVSFDVNNTLIDQSVSDVDIQVVEVSVSDIPVSEQINIEFRDACENAIMLMGRNSLGGPLQWMFDENQEYTFDYGNGIKAKRMRLFADDLTIDQWEALQDFFTLGEVYKNNIREFTSDTIKTATRTDNQVYVIDSDGNKIGVIVIPRQPSTETKQVKHTFEIEIEYPEQFA